MNANPEQNAAVLEQPASAPVVAMIPRVNIHAYVDNQSTAQVIQTAANDRRVSKAHVEIHMGGVDAASQVYADAQTPPVLIIETQQHRDQFMAELGRLAQVCDPSTKVIVIGHVNDVIMYQELMNSGVSAYMVAPLNPLQLIESISTLFADPDARPIGQVVAFVGAKGGVGSSTIAHNAGWLISKHLNTETVITDLDMAFGTASLNFNHDPAQGIAEALGQADQLDGVLIDRLLTKCSDRLSLLPAPNSIERDVSIEAEALETILNVVRANVPFVIVDMPNNWTPWSRQTLIQADQVVITATPELASLRNTKNIIDHLKQARTNDAPPILILNQTGIAKRPEIPLADFTKAVGLQPEYVIAYDAQTFGVATSNGQMVHEVNASSKAADALFALAQKLTGRAPVQQKKQSILAPFMEKLRKK